MLKTKKHKHFGLALGGGAARGIAHIGLIRRLEEYNIQPKIITGTSMGAIIGALYALGISSQEMQAIAKKLSIIKVLNLNPLTDLISKSTVQEILDPYIGESTFSDTRISLRIIATNLETGKSHIFSSGKIIDAILASIAIPGVFSPLLLDSIHYIDGGVSENLPLSPIKNLPVIASSVLLPNGSDISEKSFLTRNFSILRGAYNILLHSQESLAIQLYKKPIYLLSLSDTNTDYFDFGNTQTIQNELYDASQSIGNFVQIPKK